MMLEQIAINGKERIYNLASEFSTTHKNISEKLSLLTGCSVSFKIDAHHRAFPNIGVSSIKKELNFMPRHILDDLKELIVEDNK
jgi:hypothetical protein